MNKLIKITSLLFTLQIAASQYVSAQKAGIIPNAPSSGVKIDGNLKEWGDSLAFFDREHQWPYTVAKDQENLYLVIRLNDAKEQEQLIKEGLTFGINTHGRHKVTYAVTFPIEENRGGNKGTKTDDPNRSRPNEGDGGRRLNSQRAALIQLRSFQVTGFKDVVSDPISVNNTYGFKAALNFDGDNYLVYELKVPLKYFGKNELEGKDWAFNVKLNKTAPPKIDNEDDHQGKEGEEGKGGYHDGIGGGSGGKSSENKGGGGRQGGSANNQARPGNTEPQYKALEFWQNFKINN